MTPDKMPQELEMIAGNAVDAIEDYWKEIYGVSFPDWNIEGFIRIAVQEAAQWGCEDEQKRHKGACSPDRIQETLEKGDRNAR